MCLIPVEGRQMTSVRMKAIGHEKVVYFCVSRKWLSKRKMSNWISSFQSSWTSAYLEPQILHLWQTYTQVHATPINVSPSLYLLCFLDMERKFSLLMRIIITVVSQRKVSYSFGPCVAWTRPCFISGRAWVVARRFPGKKNLLKESLILMESKFSSVQFSSVG